MNQFEALIHKIAQYAETVTSIAAAAVSAIDTSQLPPKWAAGVITAMGVIRVVREYVTQAANATPAPPAPKPVAGKVETTTPPIQ